MDGPVSGEVKATTEKAEDIWLRRAVRLRLSTRIMVVKIPMTAEGLKAVKILSAEGIKNEQRNAGFTANQALLAARAGAFYVSPFLGRLDDISTDGTELIRDIVQIFDNYPEITTEIICLDSIRCICTDCAKAGADIATVPYKVLMQMVRHPLTDEGIDKFRKITWRYLENSNNWQVRGFSRITAGGPNSN